MKYEELEFDHHGFCKTRMEFDDNLTMMESSKRREQMANEILEHGTPLQIHRILSEYIEYLVECPEYAYEISQDRESERDELVCVYEYDADVAYTALKKYAYKHHNAGYETEYTRAKNEFAALKK